MIQRASKMALQEVMPASNQNPAEVSPTFFSCTQADVRYNAGVDIIAAHLDHRRSYDDFYYVYPVISRRSQGVSIGVNLNPDKICNFDCIYCEVDRRTAPRTRSVDLVVLRDELSAMLGLWKSGELFAREPFASAPLAWRRLNDIAFSGDGEPTTCPVFEQAVACAWECREAAGVSEAKLVLITDAACLDRPGVKKGLELMVRGPHEIWAKLDAGSPEYYRRVNRTAVDYNRILSNISRTAQAMPLWVQSLFLKMHGQPPSSEEIDLYCGRLTTMQTEGAHLLGVQAYTVARPTPEAWATALESHELDSIAEVIRRRTGLEVRCSYGPSFN